MKKLTGNEIRLMWLDFFKKHGHAIEPGASLIPHNDPTLLWINSGVAALKKYFDGSVIPANHRITNVQKSIRTNDIENVGKTARHHTFFEMLGNFSIGDYFRESVIPWAYEILTSEEYFALPKDKVYFTYLPTDKDTYNLWRKVGVKEDHLIPLEGNFWQIGEGPCGPNTEVFFDRGEKYDPLHRGIELLKNDEENDRYIEIWGIVFSQYNAVEGVNRADYKELPKKNIDTGAGLERIACVLQETPTNFETDLFLPIIQETMKISKQPYEGANLMAYRVIADHIRACTFALADGATFSNEGRGYVLRRLLRRAMRYGRKININQPFLYLLVHVVVNNFKDFYPYLVKEEERVSKLIKAEEEKFIKTLNSGELMLRNMLVPGTALSGDDAFKLYDTYGFPIDLTVEIALEQQCPVDIKRFNELLEEQKNRAREARSGGQSMAIQSADLMSCQVSSEFLYDSLEPLKAKVVAAFVNGKKVDAIDEEGDLILDKTNFYAESGGQVSDTGRLSNNEVDAEVSEVKKAPNHQHLHHVVLNSGSIHVGDELLISLDLIRRRDIMRNHSATHLLDTALSEFVGEDTHQAGSFVGPDYLRFDFNANEALSSFQLEKIEARVNELIGESLTQETKVLPIDEAKKLQAKSLFDEKYGDVVRVVCFGDMSKEFCGGTHVANTSEIGLFLIVSEKSIASGIRRIEAVTGAKAYDLVIERKNLLSEISRELKVNSFGDILLAIDSLKKEKDALKQESIVLKDRLAAALSNDLKSSFITKNQVNVLFSYVKGYDREGLLKVIDGLKSQYEQAIIVLLGDKDGKYPLVAYCSAPVIKMGIEAGKIIRELTSILGGSGGGRADLASGAAKDASKQDKVLPYLESLIK
ncbi:MAG TPA: alanine--tRNA ligase [Bacilli bacterium]|nr:alanine--tRNA ligase [Bacilli bacterium]